MCASPGSAWNPQKLEEEGGTRPWGLRGEHGLATPGFQTAVQTRDNKPLSFRASCVMVTVRAALGR